MARFSPISFFIALLLSALPLLRASAYSFLPSKWQTPNITMQLQLGAAPHALIDGSANWDVSAADALNGWNQLLDAVQFQWVSGSNAPRGANDGLNAVFFSNTAFGEGFGSDVLAVTIIQRTGAVTTEADVIVNNRFRYDSYYGTLRQDSQGPIYDLHRIALHEFGHVIGLDHPDEHGQTVDSIMNSHISDNWTIGGDDIVAVKALYSPRITSSLFPTGKAGQRFSMQVTSNTQGASITVNNLPPGLAFNSTTHVINGVPARAGNFLTSVYVMRYQHPAVYDMRFTITPGSAALLPIPGPTGLSMMGEPMASPLGESTFLYLPGDGTFTFTQSNMFGVDVQFQNSDNFCLLYFQAPSDVPFTVGEYDGAERDWVNNHPRLDVGANGAGCNEVVGSFQVKAIAYGLHRRLLSFCATFEQHCEGQRPACRGEIRFNYDPANPPATPVITSSHSAKTTQAKSFTYQIKADKNPTAFRAYLLPEGLSFDPATATISGTPAHAGEYDIVLAADNAVGTGTGRLHLSISQPSPPPFTLANISTRVQASASSPGIGGFIIQGSGTKRVCIRALGPSLATAGVTKFLTKPELEIHDASGRQIAYNFRWPDTQWPEIDNTGFSNVDFDDSIIVQDLAPGAYTAVVKGYNGASGVALVEIYDLDWSAGSSLANISTRGKVGVGDNVMIAGFILVGAQPTKVCIRALGPDLTANGVAGALQNPALQLYNGDGVLIGSNDNWRSSQSSEISAAHLAPGNNADAAILTTLAAGNYTAIVRGVGDTSGVALVEVYNLR